MNKSLLLSVLILLVCVGSVSAGYTDKSFEDFYKFAKGLRNDPRTKAIQRWFAVESNVASISLDQALSAGYLVTCIYTRDYCMSRFIELHKPLPYKDFSLALWEIYNNDWKKRRLIAYVEQQSKDISVSEMCEVAHECNCEIHLGFCGKLLSIYTLQEAKRLSDEDVERMSLYVNSANYFDELFAAYDKGKSLWTKLRKLVRFDPANASYTRKPYKDLLTYVEQLESATVPSVLRRWFSIESNVKTLSVGQTHNLMGQNVDIGSQDYCLTQFIKIHKDLAFDDFCSALTGIYDDDVLAENLQNYVKRQSGELSPGQMSKLCSDYCRKVGWQGAGKLLCLYVFQEAHRLTDEDVEVMSTWINDPDFFEKIFVEYEKGLAN